MPAVLQAAAPAILRRRPLLVSIAAGTSLQQLQSFVAAETSLPIIRVMPNINALAGEGAAAVCGNPWVSKEQIDAILGIFRAFGKAWEIPEKDFGIFAGYRLVLAGLCLPLIRRAVASRRQTRPAQRPCHPDYRPGCLRQRRMVMETDDTPGFD